jgi:hypothetical protein
MENEFAKTGKYPDKEFDDWEKDWNEYKKKNPDEEEKAKEENAKGSRGPFEGVY